MPFSLPNASTPATQQIAYGIAATEIVKWIVRGERSEADNQILSLDALSWQTQRHQLTRQPQCAACGDAATVLQKPAMPLILESRRKTFTDDGAHRSVGPEETLRRYEYHVSPICGAVSVLERHSMTNDGPGHVYLAGDNFAAQHHNLKDVQWSLRNRSAGKGISDLQARASGLCEALERYSGVFQGTETRRKARLKELDGLGIHPNDCMLFSDQQYRQSKIINAKGSRHCHVPVRFDEDAEIEWTPVWSLTHKIHRYLPTQYCYYDYHPLQKQQYCIACSNGNAAGNTLEEAILQGFFELVERDSVALWWYNQVRRPAVDLDSFDEAYLGKLKAFLKERDREFWVLDLTSDLGIPAFTSRGFWPIIPRAPRTWIRRRTSSSPICAASST